MTFDVGAVKVFFYFCWIAVFSVYLFCMFGYIERNFDSKIDATNIVVFCRLFYVMFLLMFVLWLFTCF